MITNPGCDIVNCDIVAIVFRELLRPQRDEVRFGTRVEVGK